MAVGARRAPPPRAPSHPLRVRCRSSAALDSGSGVPGTGRGGLPVSDTQDVDALRARIAELESQLAAAGPPPSAVPEEQHHVRGLSVVSAVLVILACVLAPLSVTSVWASRV